MIVLDGHHPDTGQRIHIIKGHVKPQTIANALVLGEKTYNQILKGTYYV